MRKQHTIINANDIHAALAGEHVEPLNLTPDEGKKEAKKTTRRTTRKATTKKSIAAEVCKQLCFCFDVKPEVIYFKGIDNMNDLKAINRRFNFAGFDTFCKEKIQKYRQYLAQVEKDLLDGLQRLQEAEQVARYYQQLVKGFSEFAQSHYDRSFQQTYFRN